MERMSEASTLGYVHLHVHSAFSLLEGAMPVTKLAKLALADGMPALAITDTNNLFGALEFSVKMAESGIQPLIGIELTLEFADREKPRNRLGEGGDTTGSIVLLAASEEGYLNLMALSSRLFLEFSGADCAALPASMLKGYTAGLIALTGGRIGPVNRALSAGFPQLAQSRLLLLKSLFPNALYIELERMGSSGGHSHESRLLALSAQEALPIVAANNAYFATEADFEAQDALLCIASGVSVDVENRRRMTINNRFKSRDEMVSLFADLPQALRATIEIAKRCHFRPQTIKPLLPRFTAGAEAGAESAELRLAAYAGLEQRLAKLGMAEGLERDVYDARLDFELSVIEGMNFPGYFLIVADFISWAKKQGIPVGPGRGSGAGSLVAYALTITDLDPLRYGLLFERFLNPSRVSMPDFDIDFCQDRRDEVIDYVVRRYGSAQVAQIITFGSLLARGVMRDVGRVLGLRYGEVDRLTKLVPQNPAKPITLAQAIAEEPQLREAALENEAVGRMLAIAQKLEGLYRHASTHAAGIVIADRPLEQLVPLYRDPKSNMPVTQFNMKWVEPAGLVKFDFLGLKTLTLLKGAVDLLAQRGIEIDLLNIPMNDEHSFAMLARGETVGVFQVESGGMRRALIEMKPDRIEDIIALVALYRPGPMANIPVYCEVKHGMRKPDYAHPMLEPILKETFGVIVYQEQVMEIAKVMSGYALGEADLLRRAMGKKIKAEMDAQRNRFVEGALTNNVSQKDADIIFDLLARFADYGFNKSHAAAYAVVSYQTAYMKANYPVEFIAASMNLELSNTDKLAEFRREAMRLAIVVMPPDINRSGALFDVCDGAILYALSAIKGVGVEAARGIIQVRGSRPFASIADFARRIDPRLINRRTLEQLIGAGAFDTLEPHRARLLSGMDRILAEASKRGADEASGQAGLFSAAGNNSGFVFLLPEAEPMSLAERMRREHAAAGFYLSGHPLDRHSDIIKRAKIQDFSHFQRSARENGVYHARLAATLMGIDIKRTRTGSKMAILTLSDPSGQFEAMLFAELLVKFRALLEPGTALMVALSASVDGDELKLRILDLESLSTALRRTQKGIRLRVSEQGILKGRHRQDSLEGVSSSQTSPLEQICQVLKQGRGGEMRLELVHANGVEFDILLGDYDLSGLDPAVLSSIPGVLDVVPF